MSIKTTKELGVVNRRLIDKFRTDLFGYVLNYIENTFPELGGFEAGRVGAAADRAAEEVLTELLSFDVNVTEGRAS